jgi:hypothetical protein
MKQKHVESFEGSPQPSDVFTPHMPGVDLLADMDALFETARHSLLTGEFLSEKDEEGQRGIAMVTTERLINYALCPPPGNMQEDFLAPVKELLPPEPPLNISVVSYTFPEALLQDTPKCIPFLGYLMGWGYIGHSVIIFEGHPSAFESGIRNSDVLFVDSGMLPFMQDDWGKIAYKVMRPDAKIFIHDRETYSVQPVARSGSAQGWQYSEPDGEASYANSLLTTLAKGTHNSVRITSGCALPNPADLTINPEELDWIAGLPFKYDELNADEVIKIILHSAGWRWYHFFKTSSVLSVRLAAKDKEFDELEVFWFVLTLTKDANGRKQLLIKK